MNSAQLNLTTEDLLALKPSHVCLFEHGRHPKWAEIEAATREYFDTRWPWPSEAAKRKFLKLGIESLVPLWHPHARDDLILAASIWCTTYFIIDDLMEQATTEGQRVARIFPLTLGTVQPTKGDAFEEVIFDIHERCRLAGNEADLECFRKTSEVNIRWMGHVLAKSKEVMKGGSETKIYETFDDIVKERLKEVGTIVLFPFCQWVCNITLPQAILDDPYIKAVEDITLEHAMYTNDIYSLQKELIEAIEKERANIKIIWTNTVFSLSEKHGISLREAMKELEGRLVALERRFLEAAEEAKLAIEAHSGREGFEMVEMYLETIKLFIAGNVAWHAQCKRYSSLS